MLRVEGQEDIDMLLRCPRPISPFRTLRRQQRSLFGMFTRLKHWCAVVSSNTAWESFLGCLRYHCYAAFTFEAVVPAR
jgi:hypothetical protein